jgi:hypothetical protein
MATQTFTESGTWTCPTGVTSIQVECWGSGARGDNCSSTYSGAGNGGGGYSKVNSMPVTVGTQYTVTVGTANGSTNTSVTSGAVSCIALYSNSHSGAGTGTGDTVVGGGNGANKYNTYVSSGGGGCGNGSAGNASFNTGGTGANGGGNGGKGGMGGSHENGTPGAYPGGGGGGGGFFTDGFRGTGGDGAAGQVILTWTASAVATNVNRMMFY